MRPFPLRWILIPTIFALCAMMGCQGFSAAKTTTTTTQTDSSGSLIASSTDSTFGSVTTNTSQSQPETLTNTGTSSISVTQAQVTGSEFSTTGLTLPLTLDAGQSANFKIIFTPKTTGNVTGSIALTSDASNPSLMINLSGTGASTTVAGTVSASSTSVAFGSVPDDTTQTQPETLANTGGSSLTITQASVTGSGFSISGLTLPLTLTAGQSATFNTVFNPKSAGSASGALTLSSDASNPSVTINFSGTGTSTTVPGTLSASSTSFSFGSVPDNTSQSEPETLTNTGGSSISITQATVTGSAFSISGFGLPLTLTAGQSTTFNTIFSPKASGDTSGTLNITSNASNTSLSISLAGTGTTVAGQLTVSPATLNLGNVVVGSTGTASGTLTASGASVTISSASSTSSHFALSGLSLPITISAGQQASFTVTFTPQATGAASGSITFTSNANPSSTTASLTGTGTAPPAHTVNLSWNASTSNDVVGYNIYRAPFTSSCGTYARLNSELNPSTAYSDSSVNDGSNYCYVTTAVGSDNEESAYSTPVQVSIPTS